MENNKLIQKGLSYKEFEKQIKIELKKLNKEKLAKWSWLYVVRFLPFLVTSFENKNTKNLKEDVAFQKYLIAMFYSIDTCMVISLIKNHKLSMYNRTLDRTLALALACTRDLTRVLDLDLDLVLDRALALALTRSLNLALNLTFDFDSTLALTLDLDSTLALTLENNNFYLKPFYGMLINDIKNISNNKFESFINDKSVYNGYWEKFQELLKECGCEYWADVYNDLWESKFQPDVAELEKRIDLPPEYLDKGAAAAAIYLESAKKFGTEELREVRMLILGDAESGKTSFARRFKKIDADLPEVYERTIGVNVNNKQVEELGIDYNDHVPVSLKNIFPEMKIENDVNVHIWDFAGQTIMHPIHSLFLSKDCVYVLVYRDNPNIDNHLRYWLEKIRQYGKNSKIFILVNTYDSHRFDMSFETEIKDFAENNIEVCPVSIGYDKWRYEEDQKVQKELFNDFRIKIAQYLSERHTKLTAPVVEVKKYLDEQFIEHKSCINIDDFTREVAIILKKKFPEIETDPKSIKSFLSNFMHILGLALYYEKLNGFNQVVLNPLWIARAIYEIASSAKSKITMTEIKSILINEKRKNTAFIYNETDIRYIYRLLIEYNLAYEFTKEKETLILPLCLSDKRPPYELFPVFPDGKTLGIVIGVIDNQGLTTYMPEEVLPLFISMVHEDIYENKSEQLIWRKGVVLKNNGAFVKVERTEHDTILISATNKNGVSDYLDALIEKLHIIMRNIKTVISYRIMDVSGNFGATYESASYVKSGLKSGNKNPNGHDLEKTAMTYNLYVDKLYAEKVENIVANEVTAENAEKIIAENVIMNLPEDLSERMIEEFGNVVKKFMESDDAKKLPYIDYTQLNEDITNMEKAEPGKKRSFFEKIYKTINEPKVVEIVQNYGPTIAEMIAKFFQQ